MPESEDVTSTSLTLLGSIAALLVDNTNVILLSLSLAAALKALPSLYAGPVSPKKRLPLITAEDSILFTAAFLGYLFTAGTGDQKFAILGLTIAAVGKSVPSLLEGEMHKGDPDRKYGSAEDWMMFGITFVSVALWVATGSPSYAIYGLVFAFIAKGLGSFGE
jgi:hypothetical protein